ncbi:hypothetical protein [Marinithermofilum abyssi]|uniref:hypothetical protein n=1 Tax=Marinithermofilum abyssi TaxID=1571185 RepID=UPI0016635A4F|nr:hypothetical protein [Marinithermofilum abyssi]
MKRRRIFSTLLIGSIAVMAARALRSRTPMKNMLGRMMTGMGNLSSPRWLKRARLQVKLASIVSRVVGRKWLRRVA